MKWITNCYIDEIFFILRKFQLKERHYMVFLYFMDKMKIKAGKRLQNLEYFLQK